MRSDAEIVALKSPLRAEGWRGPLVAPCRRTDTATGRARALQRMSSHAIPGRAESRDEQNSPAGLSPAGAYGCLDRAGPSYVVVLQAVSSSKGIANAASAAVSPFKSPACAEADSAEVVPVTMLPECFT